MENNIKKIWGVRQRLLKTKQAEIDLLKLEKRTKCSWHTHQFKTNRFILIYGDVRINTGFGSHKLVTFEPFDVEPPLIHEFEVKRNSLMIEIAYVNEGEIDPDDIKRLRQGGKFVKRKFYTHEELQKMEWEKNK